MALSHDASQPEGHILLIIFSLLIGASTPPTISLTLCEMKSLSPPSTGPDLEGGAPELLRRGTVLHPRFERPIRYTAYRRAPDDEQATADTIGLMHRFVAQDARAPSVRAAAYQAIAHLPARHEPKEIEAVFWWVRRHVRLIEDSELAAPLTGVDASEVEVLIRPVDLLVMTEPAGDCDCQAMLAAAMLRALGIHSVFQTIAADRRDLSLYSHVHLVAYPSRGAPVALDVSHGPGPGWSAPALGKARTWRQPMMTLRAVGVDWGSVLQTGIETGVTTTSAILKARLAVPPAGTYIQKTQQGETFYRQLPGASAALQFPTTQITGGWTSIVLLAVVALVLILALRGRS